MAKTNVIIFDGEDKFISKKKHVYNKNKGKSVYVGADGNEEPPKKTTPVTVVSTSTTTQETALPSTPSAPKASGSYGAYQGNEAPPKDTNIDQYRGQTPGGTVSTNKPGQTFTKFCPPGFVFSDVNGVCERADDGGYTPPANPTNCVDGQYFDPIYNKCIDLPNDCNPPKLLIGGKCVDAPQTAPKPSFPYDGNEKPPNARTKCPDGFIFNVDNGACENPDDGGYKKKDPTQCEDNQYFDPIYNKCIDIPPNCPPPNQLIGGKCVAPYNPTPDITKCPDGYIFDSALGKCVPYTKEKIQTEEPTTTTSTTTTTTTKSSGGDGGGGGGGNVIIPGLGVVPGGGGTSGGGGGGGGGEDAPQPIVVPKNYFWYYVGVGALGFYLLRKILK